MRVWFVAALAACSSNGVNPDGGPGGGDGKKIDAPSGALTPAQVCAQKTNFYRTTVPAPGTGSPRPAVSESAALDSYAATGAMYDFSNSPHAHFMATGGGGIAFAENECPQQLGWTLMGDINTTVENCVTAFYNGGPGEGHYENMMGNYGSLGCGIYESNGKITIIQDFGN